MDRVFSTALISRSALTTSTTDSGDKTSEKATGTVTITMKTYMWASGVLTNAMVLASCSLENKTAIKANGRTTCEMARGR